MKYNLIYLILMLTVSVGLSKTPTPAPIQYNGTLDEVSCDTISGRIQDSKLSPEIKVSIYLDDVFSKTIKSSSNKFATVIPVGWKDGKIHSVSAKVAGTNISLSGSPKTLLCSKNAGKNQANIIYSTNESRFIIFKSSAITLDGGNYLLKFQGKVNGPDSSIMLDSISLNSNIINNFEVPITNTYIYDFPDSSWKYVGAGIQRNGSAWSVPNAPEGSQTGFIQNLGFISKNIFLPKGNYIISFYAAQRISVNTSPQILEITLSPSSALSTPPPISPTPVPTPTSTPQPTVTGILIKSSSAIVSWDKNSEDSVIGYKIHYGNASGNYTKVIDVSNSLKGTISNLENDKIYFVAVSAYSNETESELSDEISFTVKLK